ncbi:MAG: NAD-dependent succinate-semialdehyde dehydrogenase [Candidatus Woesearchaeota archaeon]|nr:NAD-dependent succinate-semialdehyde dehydrogenase [Candidatus Woesearchaeota archaeon]
MKARNPTTGEQGKEYQEHTPDEAKQIVDDVHTAWQSWKTVPFAERATLMKKAAEVLRANKEQYAQLMTDEMGKLLGDGVAEVEKCAWVCEYYAENAEQFLADELRETDASKSYVSYQPIGIVLAVMPWNYPFWQVFRFAAPNIMGGNCGVLKHASNVPGCALAIESVFKEAGFPKNVFRTLMIGARKVNAVLEHPHVRAATLTGSTPAGKAVASKAGAVLKKTVLELGGSDPYIILEDADIATAAATSAISRLLNAGQACICAKRLIVVESVKEQFTDAFVKAMHIPVGDPSDKNTRLGPMSRHDLRDELHDQVERSIAAGAKILLGGEVPDNPGAFYPATVLDNVQKGNPAYEEEFFGPVASIITVKDEAEAIAVANDSVFGLGAAVFSEDIGRAENVARQIEAGAVFVNDFVKSDPRMPFGGVKESGYGRELSEEGIREFMNAKTVVVR